MKITVPVEGASFGSPVPPAFLAPENCTSEPGFASFLERFGRRFERAGVGAVLPLP